MKNAWGTKEKESIYGIRNSINCLSCECMRLMFFAEQQNLIKSKCWMRERTFIWFAFVAFRCIWMSEPSQARTQFFRAVEWFECVQFIWKVYDMKSYARVCAPSTANEKDTNCHDEPHTTIFQLTVCLCSSNMHKSLCARKHTQAHSIDA